MKQTCPARKIRGVHRVVLAGRSKVVVHGYEETETVAKVLPACPSLRKFLVLVLV